MASDLDISTRLKVLYVTVFLTATGFGTATFMLPVYAALIGAGYLDLGLIGAISNIVYTFMTITIGYLLDRFERLRIYIGFMTLGAVVVLVFSLIDQVQLLIAWSSLLGLVSAAFWVTASTLTANISPSERLTESMGRFNLSWVLGFIVGPSIGGLVSEAYGFKVLYASLAGLVVVSVSIVGLRLMPGMKLINKEAEFGLNLGPIRKLASAYATLLPFAVVLGIYMAIMPGYLKIVGLAPALVGYLLTTTNAIRGLGFFNAKRFVGLGTRKSVGIASLLLFASMVIFSMAHSLLEFLIPLAMYGAAAGIMTPVILDYIAKRCDKSALGAAMGAHEGVYGVGMCIGPMVGGAIAAAYGPQLLYQLLGIFSLLILPLSSMLDREKG